MPLVALFVYAVAGLTFLAASFRSIEAKNPKHNLVAFGLTIFTAAVICQFLIHANIVQ